MMKKYRLKVDCPWGQAGAVICGEPGVVWMPVEGEVQMIGLGGTDPNDWPSYFEPVEEKSDVDRYVEWSSRQPCGTAKDNEEFIKKLIVAGLRVEDLK